jgi:hypothetical protein
MSINIAEIEIKGNDEIDLESGNPCNLSDCAVGLCSGMGLCCLTVTPISALVAFFIYAMYMASIGKTP